MNIPYHSAEAMRSVLVAESIGHLVPQADFTGRVHTIFARACNLACNDMLLTLCAANAGDGPTTLRLARGAAADLRGLFSIGERVTGRRGRLRTERAEIDLTRANIWRPAAPRPLLPRARIEANLQRAENALARHRGTRESVIDRGAAPLIAALRDACGALDRQEARRQAGRLIGLGEGLTPAGDDFLLGLLAGLEALLRGDAERHRFRDALALEFTAHAQRTTPIAAHFLRLAAAGHYTASLLDLRAALLGQEHADVIDRALAAALAVGATSGADTVSGLLAGLTAWVAPRPGICG